MTLRSCFELSSPDVVAEDFGTEIVVLNLSNGKYFSLIGAAVDIWKDILGGHHPGGLLDQLESDQYKHTETVRNFILDLIHQGLIRPIQNTVKSVPSNAAVALINDAEPPNLASFDDMAELILADPIHDVEEDIGWPAKRTTE